MCDFYNVFEELCKTFSCFYVQLCKEWFSKLNLSLNCNYRKIIKE